MQRRYVSSLAASVFLGGAAAAAADLPSARPLEERASREQLLFAPSSQERALLGPLREGAMLGDASIERVGWEGDVLWLVGRRDGRRGQIGLSFPGRATFGAAHAIPSLVHRGLEPDDVAALSRALDELFRRHDDEPASPP